MTAIPFPQISIDCFVKSICREFLCWFPLVVGMVTFVLRCENCAILWGKKIRVAFCEYSFHWNELTGYLIRFIEICPKCLSHINAPKCVRLLWNIEIGLMWVPVHETHWKIFHCQNLWWIFSRTSWNIREAWHTLLALYLLSDIVQFVGMSALMLGPVIPGQLSTLSVKMLFRQG